MQFSEFPTRIVALTLFRHEVAMPYRTWTVFIVALFLSPDAAPEEDIRDFDPLFSSHDTLEVEIEGPFAMLARERSDEEETEGKFRYTEADGTPVEFDIQIRARGNWRRNPDICKFPPLRINFKKSQTDDTLFDKQDKMKLVTHCQNNSRRYDQAVISEYLAYRIFNLLTDASYRVRLLKMKYVFTDRNTVLDTYGVLIEHDERIGKRIGGEPVETERVPVASIKPSDLSIASVFQYFLGNTDFSPKATGPDEECCHNQSLFTSDDGLYYTIPYDFDQSGLVDAQHAAPNPRFGIRTVRVRLYRGRCVNNELLPQTLQLYRDRRDEIEALITNQAELESGTQRSMLKYIDSFYETIDDPKRVESRIVEKCI
jgi:hypothetical protein